MSHYALMASLPWLPPVRAIQRLPITRVQLDRRLEALDEGEAAILRAVEELLNWGLAMKRSEEGLWQAATEAQALCPTPTLRALIEYEMLLRSLAACIRLRRNGEGFRETLAPALGEHADTVRLHWSQPEFRLAGHLPFLPALREALEESHSLAVETILRGQREQALRAAEAHHEFDLTAVILYVLRWRLLAEKTRHDGPAARERFARLAERTAEETVHV